MGSRFSVVSVAQTSGTVEVESMETGNFKKFDLSEENIEKLLASGVMLKLVFRRRSGLRRISWMPCMPSLMLKT